MATQLSGGREAISEDQAERRKVSCLLKVGRHMAGSYHLSQGCPAFHLPGKRILSFAVQEGKAGASTEAILELAQGEGSTQPGTGYRLAWPE